MGTEGGPLTRVVGELVEQTGLPCAGFTYTHVGGQFMYAADHECYTPIMMNFMRKSRSLSVRGESTERGDPTYHRSRVVLWHSRRSQSKPWQSWSWSRVTMMGPVSVAAEGTRRLASPAQLDRCGHGQSFRLSALFGGPHSTCAPGV